MKIVSLRAENIKRLRAVEITPTGDVIQITGRNSQGKSSVLDSIWYAMGGGKSIPDKPLREGARKGSVELNLGDLVVIRKFTAKGTTLEVYTGDGVQQKSPQKILDELVGRLSFDPLQFLRMKPADQAQTLRAVVDLEEDLEALDQERAALYQQRTEINRTTKQLEAMMDGIQYDPDAPDREESAADLLAEIQAAEDHNRQGQQARDKLEAARGRVDQARDRVRDLEVALANARAQLEEAADQAAELDMILDGWEPADSAPLRDRLAGLEATNRAAREKQQAQQLLREARASQAESDRLTAAMEALDDCKRRALEAADWPIDGLALGGETVLYQGLPLAQASTSEQVKISMALAMASNPGLRVVRVADGSLLDSSSLALVADIAAAHDCQVWIEAVDESGKVGVVIEDGLVVADNYAVEG